MKTARNPVQIENSLPGTTAWQLTRPAVNREIEGYASLTSVNRGGAISFFVNTAEPRFDLEIFRMGWYGGAGARLIYKKTGIPGRVQTMPAATADGLIECRWVSSHAMNVPANLVSGVCLARLTSSATKRQAYIIFVVRDDDRHSDLLFQTSVTTYQAYNNWPGQSAGGKSLYEFNSAGNVAAVKVSFNRPYGLGAVDVSRAGLGAGHFLTHTSPEGIVAGWEYNMLRWMEKEGYDVTYISNLDTHTSPGLLLCHKGFLSVGHDEYWSWEMRANVEAARDQRVNLGFFSANVCYWQIRFEPALHGAANRTMVTYKFGAQENDPMAKDASKANNRFITGLWRENSAKRSEEALLGVQYIANSFDLDIVISNPHHWSLAGTGLVAGSHLAGLLGYEGDAMFPGSAPPNTALIAHSPIPQSINEDTQAYPFSDVVSYTAPNGATVFATGTFQWSWGLDDYGSPSLRTSRLNGAVQTITRNVLRRFVAPPPPTHLSVILTSSDTVLLTWKPSNAVNVAGYSVYRGTSNGAKTALPLFLDTGLTHSTAYTYTVAAFDTAGNVSDFSNAVQATTKP